MPLNASTIPTEPAYHGEQRDKLPIIGMSPSQVNGNYTIQVGTDIPIAGRELFIGNDGNASLTITVSCNGGQLVFTILAGEQFDERLPTFTAVAVAASGNWRWKVRGNLT